VQNKTVVNAAFLSKGVRVVVFDEYVRNSIFRRHIRHVKGCNYSKLPHGKLCKCSKRYNCAKCGNPIVLYDEVVSKKRPYGHNYYHFWCAQLVNLV
jgi:hypothetical protein